MGYMIDGEWHPDLDRPGNDGPEFEREQTAFRDAVGGAFPAEPGRYHLYVSYSCPWAHRTLVTRALVGLEDAVSVAVVDPIRGAAGWEFSPDLDGCTPDAVNGFDSLHEAYSAADPAFTGRVTVPVLWDTGTGTIVNNESEEIIKQLAGELAHFGTRAVDLYPPARRAEIDDVIDDIYPAINDGVYRAGFAGSQAAYDEAVETLFDALDEWNRTLSSQRYLAGDELSLADVCMFTTLYRFDEVYHTHFKCNRRRVEEYEHLWGYLRELYQLPGVRGTCRMDHVKTHYYRSHSDLNPTGFVPVGPAPDFDAPHGRDRLPGGPPDPLAPAAE